MRYEGQPFLLTLHLRIAILPLSMNRLFVLVAALLPASGLFTGQPGPLVRAPETAFVIFGPAEAERDSLGREEAEGIEEVIADFVLYSGRIRPLLDSLRISVVEIDKERFRLAAGGREPLSYDRQSLGSVVGYILVTKGKQPLVLGGVRTDDELRAVIARYFGLHHRKAR